MTPPPLPSPAWLPALALVGGALLATAITARVVFRVPRPLALAVALALLIVAETIAMNVLSAAGALGRLPVVAAQLGIIAVCAATTLRVRRRGAWSAARGLQRAVRSAVRAPYLLACVLVVLSFVSGVRYAPNNGDGLTYHLARVVHWMQASSVQPYPSGSIRQNVMMPGAEYVLLALQVLASSDRLAFLVQWIAYVAVIAAAPWLARLAGSPRRYASWAAPLVAALPMATLQASSTQNDLVAAALGVSVVASCVRLAARPAGRSAARGALLAAACCSAALVTKVSALIVSLPFIVAAAVRMFGPARRVPARAWALPLAAGVVLAAVVAGPELIRRDVARTSVVVPMYPVIGEWGDRFLNAARGALHHLPLPSGWVPGAIAPAPPSYDRGRVLGLRELVPHEDFVGNPLHAIGILLLVAAAVARGRRTVPRARWFAAGALLGWFALHASLRDNEYFTRLQLPAFAIAPVFLAALPRPRGRWAVAVPSIAAVAVVLAVVVAARSPLRPPFAARVEPAELDYYRLRPLLRGRHATSVQMSLESGCREAALFMGESGFDYPLTWQLVQHGIRVRHLIESGDAARACLVYVEQISFAGWGIPRAPVALAPDEWAPIASDPQGAYLYARRGPPAGGPVRRHP